MLEFLILFIFLKKLKIGLILKLLLRPSKLFFIFFKSESGFLKLEILLISFNLLSKKNSVSTLLLELSFNQNNNVDVYIAAKDILLV